MTSPLTWTRETPTEAGVWLYMNHPGDEVQLVGVHIQAGEVMGRYDYDFVPTDSERGRGEPIALWCEEGSIWIGPIPDPSEAPQ